MRAESDRPSSCRVGAGRGGGGVTGLVGPGDDDRDTGADGESPGAGDEVCSSRKPLREAWAEIASRR